MSILLDTPAVYGLHLICAQNQLLSLVAGLEQARAAHAPGTLTILDWGWSCKQHTGYVVLSWATTFEGDEAYQAYADELQRMEVIIDMCTYELPPPEHEEEDPRRTTD
ncbi:hypothetical protein KDH_12230 [Dictyobacter sp. S3.2.2.5]|uniref:DUF4242 domain-containing protein n=1 Tax=Dictyobacter halimunensis TaxID=3026934 RepID=A0ABQ6FJJ3_9CHLR|nr:hypothetical protein KDH_12230 [Dictyobacter sp. S3.2.2.5]